MNLAVRRLVNDKCTVSHSRKNIYNGATLCIYMKPIRVGAEDVVLALETNEVLRTDELMRMFDCSRRTLYVKLSQCDFISSLNFNSRYLTLTKTPEFDNNGLWNYKGKVFSKWGGIKETIVMLVDSSKMGLTPSQISYLLKTRVTSQLLTCLKEGKLNRIRYGRNQVYFSIARSIEKSQTQKREKWKNAKLLKLYKEKGFSGICSFEIEKVHFGYLAQLLLSETLSEDDIYIMLDAMGKSVERRERSEVKEIVVRHKINLKKTQLELVFQRR
jgi:hypothetical protein